jgi:isocitrate lyase
VAGDANLAGEMYPDQSLYPANSVPMVVKRINNTFTRADQIQWMEGTNPSDPGYTDYFLPIVADAEAGFGGVLNAFELMKSMIEAGAAGVHFEDQLASVKKCGHMGGKVLVPSREAVAKLVAARLASDVMGVPTVLLARTDAEAADLITSDVDENDKAFLTGERTVEGFYRTKPGLEQRLPRHLQRPFTSSSQARCWRTTARQALTGRKILTTAPSRSSSVNSVRWATSSSSSHWQASTA